MKTRELLVLPLIFLLSVGILRADSAIWNLNPGDWNWTTATNWTPATVPNGPGDTATFGPSNVTGVVDWSPTQLDGIVFNSNASAFTIVPDQLTISGAGITNNSGATQNFLIGYSSPQHSGTINFIDGAKAGSRTVFTTEDGSTQFFHYSSAESGTFKNHVHGTLSFFDNSSAGNGTFINAGGATFFRGSSRAGTGTFQNNGAVPSDTAAGTTTFADSSTAENATFTNNGSPGGGGGGVTSFLDNSTAGNGIFIINEAGGVDYHSGFTDFRDDSSGGTAQIRVFGYGRLAIYYHNAPGVTIGSLEGNGGVYLGSNRLRIGSNNLSTTFAGYIEGSSGSLEKIGTGTLTLSRAFNEIAGILISGGTLRIEGAWLGSEYISVTTPGATLRLQNGATNNYIADTSVFSIVSGSTVDLNFNGTDRVESLVVDGVAQPAGFYGSAASGAPHQLPEFTGSGMIQATTGPLTPKTQATNLSTRLLVGTGNSVTIGGFIVAGPRPKMVAIRGIGPSLSRFGLTGLLPDPILELRDSAGAQLVRNDNWLQAPAQAEQLLALGHALQDPAESGIVATLQPGAYTAILSGSTPTTGIGLVEILDVDLGTPSQLANLSTRGLVQNGDQVMIGGFILGGNNGSVDVIVRGLGPSLIKSGLDHVLADPALELRDSDGGLLVANDNWQDDPVSAAQLIAHGIAPQNSLESGVFATLPAGPFTALLTGKNGGVGIGLVEVYNASLIGATPPPPMPTPTPVPTPSEHRIVINTADTGAGTLREAIAIAHDNALIEFDPALNGQTITLTGSELSIDKSLTISGPGAGLLAVARNNVWPPPPPIFHIMPGRTVTIRGLTVSGATPYSGAISDSGAITNYGGNVTIESCTLSHNEGAIHNQNGSTMLVINSNLTQNGPAIFNQGALEIRNSLLTSNNAHIGAAIWNYGSVTVTGSSLSENTSGAGGAIWNWTSGTIIVTDSTISGNSVYGYRVTNGPSAPGVGGGIENGGALIIVNSTISGNAASSTDDIYFHGGFGGAIYNWNGILIIANSTFSANHSAVSDRGGGIYVSSGTLQITNTILSAGTIGANLVGASTNILSGGYNLSSDDGAGSLTAAGDQINTDPTLGPLQDNGGPTFTHQLLGGSPGLDAGDPNFAPPPIYDQRGPGYDRVHNGRVDIGSFERQPCCPPSPTPARSH